MRQPVTPRAQRRLASDAFRGVMHHSREAGRLFRIIPHAHQQLAEILAAEDGGQRVRCLFQTLMHVGSSRVDLQACKLEYSIVSPK